ncbi:DoxX family protein [Subtercola sp. YIM 133946]|uniref:DoxX family protein n=1 Tax=Subtercola sp. YIM 133946 TaxID=3118909 RepID=UPI002F93F129
MNLGKLFLRLLIGGLFVGHGLQKLTGSFDGPGLDGAEKMMSSIDMKPARRNAVLAAGTETFGGAAFALGLLTPVASAGLVATMLTAVRKVHWKNGVWNSGGGFEYNAVLIAAVTALSEDGPGTVSLDSLFGKRRWGVLGGVLALGGGIIGSLVAVELGKRASEAAASADDADEAEELVGQLPADSDDVAAQGGAA